MNPTDESLHPGGDDGSADGWDEDSLRAHRVDAVGIWIEPLVAFVLHGDANADSHALRQSDARLWVKERPDDPVSVLRQVREHLARPAEAILGYEFMMPPEVLVWAHGRLQNLSPSNLWAMAVVWAQVHTTGMMAARVPLERVRRVVHYATGARLRNEARTAAVRRGLLRVVEGERISYLDLGEALCPEDARARAHAVRDEARRLAWCGGAPVAQDLYGEALVAPPRPQVERARAAGAPLVSHGPIDGRDRYLATSLYVGLRLLRNTEGESWRAPAMIRPRDATWVELLGPDAVLVDRLVRYENRAVAGTFAAYTRLYERFDETDVWGPVVEALRVLWAYRLAGGRIEPPLRTRPMEPKEIARRGAAFTDEEGALDLCRLAVAVGVRSLESLRRFVRLFGPDGVFESGELVEATTYGNVTRVRISDRVLRKITGERVPFELLPVPVAKVLYPDREDDLDDDWVVAMVEEEEREEREGEDEDEGVGGWDDPSAWGDEPDE